jgi:phosphate-selective porin OprO/OprP
VLASVELDATWSEGIRLGSADGSTTIKFGGRLQNDWVFQSGESALLDALGDEDGPASLEDGTEFRRVRLYTEGLVRNNTEFKVQFDFAGGAASLKDAYVGVVGVPALGTVRVGHQFEPFGLEEQTCSKYIVFLERGLTSAFTPERNTGIRFLNHGARATWSGGVFRDANGSGKSTGDGEYTGTARVTFAPRLTEDGRHLVHLGGAFSYRNPADDEVSFSSGAENHLGPTYVATGTLPSDGVVIWGAEAAIVEGPVSLQSEFIMANVSTSGPDPSFSGFYVLGSYFLTGESRRYKATTGVFDRTKPQRDYQGSEGGAGAWELTARYSMIDLDDEGISGGKLSDVTAGISWYLNANFRWSANYLRADLDGAGVSNALLTRFQTDF